MGNARSSLLRSKKPKGKPSTKAKFHSDSSPSSHTSGSKNIQSRIIEGREFHNEEKSVYVLAKDDEEKDRLHEASSPMFILIYSLNMFLTRYASTSTATLFDKGVVRKPAAARCSVSHVRQRHPCFGCRLWARQLGTGYGNRIPSCGVLRHGHRRHLPREYISQELPFLSCKCARWMPFNRQFEFIQMRFFCVALRAEEWDIAYQKLYQLLKPGGYFQVLEPSILMNTPDLDLQEVIGAFTKLLEKKGQDYDIGPKIKGKFEAVGYNMLYDLKQESSIGWGNKMCVRGAEDMRSLYKSIVPFLAAELNIDSDTCRAKIDRAVDAMGPTKTTVNCWAFLGQKPLE